MAVVCFPSLRNCRRTLDVKAQINKAIGYVGVSLNVAEYRIFISTDDIQYRLPEGYCQGAKG